MEQKRLLKTQAEKQSQQILENAGYLWLDYIWAYVNDLIEEVVCAFVNVSESDFNIHFYIFQVFSGFLTCAANSEHFAGPYCSYRCIIQQPLWWLPGNWCHGNIDTRLG